MIEHPLTIKCVTTTTETDGSLYGKFVIEPLERGFGLTLGNSLRRILLSRLSGMAITSVRIENASHEYDTLDGIVEDVLDILLNLKGVVLKSDTMNSATFYLSAKGEQVVTAGQLDVPAGVQVVNPDLHICTMNEGASLNMEVTADCGTGYVPAEQLTGARSVDSLPLDAAFMPITRVAFSVENTRVGQRTDYDSLHLEIWSNGSMDVSVALSQSANLLIEHLVPIASLSGASALVLPTEVVQETQSEEIVPNITIEDLELSVRAFNCLKRANIHSIQELLTRSEADLLSIKNFGKKSADEVIERMKAFGLLLKPSPEDFVYTEDM
ncbi:MAG: DNA-directed RNA polymerase subunit alpha [Vampirovibrionales bacterium]